MSKEPENRIPLLQTLLQYENVRTAQLLAEGSCQRNYPKSNDGWMKTIFVLEGRALDLIAVPLTLLVLHATAYTLLTKLWLQRNDRAMESWEMFFSLVINTTLSFLLVFRLNRAADRYWSSRTLWGLLIARARAFSACIIAHTAEDNLYHRDEAIRWIVASVIASMELLRGVKELPVLNFSGILSKDEVYRLSANTHPPIYAFDEARYHINAIFRVTEHTPVGVAQMYARHLMALETHVDMLLECCGGLERIRGTPLPIVYVAHLRTFIVFALLFFPYLWGPSWGWATIPIVTASAFAWLGIDGAAAEAEAPFRQNRVNALDMNSYCLGYLEVVKQQLLNHAERLAVEQGR
ncbi:putative membrane protein [Fistulifera solaris]|jgi:putative membrane protein|uniref:Putative membrane protein n=1 Tax=Fistulifera solaris TaxID=1519565 RepID=A0A1Z5JNB1_FISSO|nr:putative membrane protein [Fistulifera solaris]|eukprot:GAX15513.1 putative membrane protein [Fistulifera solaris]